MKMTMIVEMLMIIIYRE